MKKTLAFFTTIITIGAFFLSGCTASINGSLVGSVGPNRQGNHGGGPVYNGLPTPTIQSLRSSGRNAAEVALWATQNGYRLQESSVVREGRHCGPSCAVTRQSVVVNRVWVRTTEIPVQQPPQYLRAPSRQDMLYQRPVVDCYRQPIYAPEWRGDPNCDRQEILRRGQLWGGPQGNPGFQHPGQFNRGGQGGFGQRTVRGPNGETLHF